MVCPKEFHPELIQASKVPMRVLSFLRRYSKRGRKLQFAGLGHGKCGAAATSFYVRPSQVSKKTERGSPW